MQFKQELLVFPTSRAIREYISTLEDNSFLPFCLTIDDFFKKSFTFLDKKLIDEEHKFLLLKESIKFDEFKKLGISSNFTQFLKQSDYIFRFFSEISSEKVDISKIQEVDTYEFYKEHLEILKKVKINYEKLLDEKGFVDKVNEQKYQKLNKSFLDKFSKVTIFFEGYFTKVEFEKVKEVSKYKTLHINLYTNEYNKKSYEVFKEFDLKDDYKYLLDISNNKLISSEKLDTKLDFFEIKGFASRFSQIAFIKKAIEISINKNIDPSKIALILPDESFASKIKLFDLEKYFNYAMGLDIYNSKTYKLIFSLYSYINENDKKNSDALSFFDIDLEFINMLKNKWNNTITFEVFELIITYIKDYETNKEIKEKLSELFYKLNFLFFNTSQNILLKEAIKILLQRLSKITLDDVNSGKITVMGLLESRNISFDSVIICDFNEGFIPKASLKDKFLSTKVKEYANLPTIKDRENLQKYYYKRILNNSKNLFISYVNNETSTISRFASELFDKFDMQKVYDSSYKHILYNSKKLNHFNKEIIKEIDLSKLEWSASSLKVFLQCKRKFYLQYILKLKEHEISNKPKGFELGDIIHKILYEFYKDYSNNYDEFLKLFNKYASKNPFLALDLEVWKKKLQYFFEVEKQRLKDVSVINIELPFNFEYKGIKIKGFIDRVDKKDDKYLVIDYKTSSSLKIDTIKNYEKTSDFQLEFYHLALQNLYKTTNIETFYYDLNSAKLLKEVAVDEKLELLSDIFESFHTKKVDFYKCEDKAICNFCSYKTICNR